MKKRKDLIILILITLIAIIFRFYNSSSLQHWSGDEELDSAVVMKMILEKRVVLVRPNPSISASLGSFFHILSVPLFLISSLNPGTALSIISILGIITTILLYKCGVMIKNRRLGLIVSFLYASSFLAGFFDRRWWPPNLNPLFTTIAIYSLIKIFIKKKYLYGLILAVPVGFIIHADPALAIILLTIILSFLYFKEKILRKEYIISFLIILVFILPLLFFEIRHKGTIFYPLLKNFERVSTTTSKSPLTNLKLIDLNMTFSIWSKLLFPKATDFAEKYFCYICSVDNPLFGLFSKIITAILIISPVYFLRKTNNLKERQSIILLLIFMVSFIISVLLYVVSFKKWLYQSYFTITFPVVFLLIGYSLYKLTEKRRIILLFIFLFYFLINSQALVNSKLRYPLSVKEKLVTEISGIIGQKNFSLYSLGNEYFYGGGYRGLFILQNRHPKKSNTYSLFDWWYQAHGLYTTQIENKDQELIVIISPPTSDYSFDKSKIIYQKSFDNIQGIVLNNVNGWFDESIVNKQ